jgi:hypothetical protein
MVLEGECFPRAAEQNFEGLMFIKKEDSFMNLTKCFVASLCLMAMTASAVVIKEDSFESGTFTNAGWSGFDSTFGVNIIGGTNGVTDANSPMVGVGDDRVLHLNTDGAVWTNTITGASFAGTTNIYVDMLVKFVPSEELPVIGTGVKLAVAVKTGTPNVFAYYVADQVSYSSNIWYETSAEINTNLWCRLTIDFSTLVIDENNSVGLVNIKTNGALVNTLPLYVEQTDYTLNSIGFQGTGYIDEVVVRDDNPFGAAIQITLSFATGVASVFVGPTQKLDTQTVDSGSDLIITAAQWKEISDVSGPGVTTNWVSGALGDSLVTVKVQASNATTVTVTSVTETSTSGTLGSSTSFDGAPMNKVAAWAIANGVSSLSDGIYTNYLYNVDDTAEAQTLLINSIAVTGTTVTVTVGAGTNNLSILNGVLKLKAWPVLGGTPVTYTNEVALLGTTNVTVQVNISTNKFVKALIE